MEESIYLTNLYEYYKDLLTDKQKEYFEDYYFDNLTLSEIGENNKISRNAVSKQLLSIKKKLIDYENKLHLLSNKEHIIKVLSEKEVKKIEEYI